MRRTLMATLCVLSLALGVGPVWGQGELVQIQEDFSEDPGWDNFQNRIIGTDMPIVTQDFGWSSTSYTGGPAGEIGGRVDNSRHQAYYAMPLGKPLTFDDEISASGKLAIRKIGLRSVGYIGFFSSKRHTWRVWSSMAFRIWEEDMLGQIMFDWMSSDWRGRGAETAILLKDDGKVHTWSFKYEPDVKADPVWRDEALQCHITDRRGNGRPYELQGEEFLVERLKKEEPDLTTASLHRRLIALRDQGLVDYFHRHAQHRWWKSENPGEGHGRITLQFDGETPYVFWMDEKIRNAPLEMDRFGLFNISRFGTWSELYMGDLTINGEKIDLAHDPHWEGRNNRVTYTEPDFQSMSDYGYSETNWAGEAPGEIGGLFWRTEPPDPMFSYYGDEVGDVTLDDPISFSGSINFVTGMTDAAGYFGYFNDQSQMQTLKSAADEYPLKNMMGVTTADATRIGYWFKPFVSSAKQVIASGPEVIFTPGPERHLFSFDYDPKGSGGVGRVDVTLDGRKFGFDLTPQQREDGAVFNRFGLANVRRGGLSVQFYLDDLDYTARRDKEAPPVFHEQAFIEVPYPHKSGGRKY